MDEKDDDEEEMLDESDNRSASSSQNGAKHNKNKTLQRIKKNISNYLNDPKPERRK